jgi:HD-GYP domain-containing protein (c-di-GMP phosphodiesterase class II)
MAPAEATEQHTQAPEASTLAELRHLLECALGAEVGVFAPGRVILPHACRRTCVVASAPTSCEGACGIVQRLASGEVPASVTVPQTCDQGHSIAVHRGTFSHATTLVLRPRAGRPQDDLDASMPDRLTAIAQIWAQCDRLVHETEGLSNELLRSYEQLNVIFDVTQQLGVTQDAAGIKLTLIRRTAEVLDSDWACCLTHAEGMLWWGRSGDADRQAVPRADLVAEVRQHRRILVRNGSEHTADQPSFSLLVGPLLEDEAEANIAVFGRRPGGPEFLSGDVMMVDAILSHGGNVIANHRLAERIQTMSFEAIRALVSAIDKKDEYTSGHSERVGMLARLTGVELGLPPKALQDLEWAGLLHDIGKIGILDTILRKPGRLTEGEYDLIKQHPRMGFDVITPIQAFAGVREAVLYHHETPDGTGYPRGLKDDAIPLAARIIHVADTFDAVTSSRSYRGGFPLGKALQILRDQMGTKLDTEVTRAFLKAFERLRIEQPDRYRRHFGHVMEDER